MSKYDFEIDLSQNSSTGIILNKLKKGSVILEFGCAAGRMTRYMKEVLGCKVYIVEYDKGAFEKARIYAEDGICDDILNYQWVKEFLDIGFDAIIFADVLEHLVEPEMVLEQAASLLKDDGCIYISIPNITHNDILLKAYEERFDYTPTGILDDTHVHFWGLKNVENIARSCGLNVRTIEGTYCSTGFTEQYGQTGHAEHMLLQNLLKERTCGEVYQFVVVLDKDKAAGKTDIQLKPAFLQSHLYLDTGNGFNEKEIIDFESVYSGNGIYTAHYEINDTKNIRNFRFDPLEGQSCILQNFSVVQGEKCLPATAPDSVDMDGGFLLKGSDPMVCVETRLNEEPIIIHADLVISGEHYIDIVQNALTEKDSECKRLTAEFGSLTAKFDNLAVEHQVVQERAAQLAEERTVLRNEIQRLGTENRLVHEKAAELNREVEALWIDLGAYIILANNKDMYCLELENKCQNLEKKLEKELNYYQNLKVVKLHFFAARIWRGLKRRLKRLLGKGEHE